jgi:quercetin dioxygenase-like cupin family protein
MKSIALGFCISVCLASATQAQVNSQDLKWAPAPPIFAHGAQMAVLSGDPSKPGQFVVRLKVPAGYRFAAHHHPTDEYVTVISGDFSLGMGDKLDESKGATLSPGGFAMAPANMNHYAWTKTGAIVQVSGAGPFVVVYVYPADDPTKH